MMYFKQLSFCQNPLSMTWILYWKVLSSSNCQKHGWINCKPLVMKLIAKDNGVKVQDNYFVHLALELNKLGLDVGFEVAKKILDMCAIACSPFNRLEDEIVVNIGEMIFHFKMCLGHFSLNFVNRMRTLKTIKSTCAWLFSFISSFQMRFFDKVMWDVCSRRFAERLLGKTFNNLPYINLRLKILSILLLCLEMSNFFISCLKVF